MITDLGSNSHYVTQCAHESDFGDSRNAKSAILTHFKALNFDFDEFLHFLKTETDVIWGVESNNLLQGLTNDKVKKSK